MLASALKWFFPLSEKHGEKPPPAGRGAVLALLPLIGLGVGLFLAVFHRLIVERLSWLPARFEALGLLALYCLLTGMRTKRALAETLAAPADGRSQGYLAQSVPAALLPVLFLLEVEFLALIVSVREDISFPGAGLVAIWPVVGRWASVLVSQGFPAAAADETAERFDVAAVSSSTFLFLSMFLLLLFFVLFPPGFFLGLAAALSLGAGMAHFMGRRKKGVSRRQIADSAAGIAETVYLCVTALLSVVY